MNRAAAVAKEACAFILAWYYLGILLGMARHGTNFEGYAWRMGNKTGEKAQVG